MEDDKNLFNNGIYREFKNNKKCDISKNTQKIISHMGNEIYSNLSNQISNIENRLDNLQQSFDNKLLDITTLNNKIIRTLSYLNKKIDVKSDDKFENNSIDNLNTNNKVLNNDKSTENIKNKNINKNNYTDNDTNEENNRIDNTNKKKRGPYKKRENKSDFEKHRNKR